MANVDRVLQVKMRRHRREVVGIMVHVMAIGDLTGAAVTAAVMSDHAKTMLEEDSIWASQSSDDSGQPWLNTMG
jgi:hypothetical protein